MKLESWPWLRTDTWPFLRRVGSAITGKDVGVVPGTYPSAYRLYPQKYLNRVCLPASLTTGKPGTPGLLNGVFAHELLHVIMTDPEATVGVRFDTFMLTNGLEDGRILTQGQKRWPGLAAPIRILDRQVTEFRRRARAMAQTAEASKLYEVAVALYLHLTGLPDSIVRETVPAMADEIAREVLPMARPALTALDTQEVVAIAIAICERLAKAAEAAAQRLGTTADYIWATTFKTELARAHEQTVEQALLNAERKAYPGYWAGPWMRGAGGPNWCSTAWTWGGDKRDECETLSRADVERALLEADPLLERWTVRPRESTGRLSASSSALVEAVVGCGQRRVFERSEHEKRLLLPGILRSLDVFVFLEAHSHFDRDEWLFMKSLTIALGRLFDAVEVPTLVVRAATTTRTKETIKDPKTERLYERWSNDYYIQIATLKEARGRWDERADGLVATMPSGVGFNQPLEGYARLKSWSITLPKSNRKRLYIVIGKADEINVYLSGGHLQSGTANLRGRREKAIYIHVGKRFDEYDGRLAEYRGAFDAFMQATTLRQTVIDTLYQVLLVMAREK